MTANFGYGNQQNVTGMNAAPRQPRARPMNLRANRQPQANVIANPFGAAGSQQNDTSSGMFDHPVSPNAGSAGNNMFMSDNPQHNGIQMEEPSDMFVADPMVGDAQQDNQPAFQQAPVPRGPPSRMPHQQPRPRVAVPPRRQPQVPNAGLFGGSGGGENGSRQDQAPPNSNLFSHNQEVVEQQQEQQDYSSEGGHQTVEFEEDVGFHQDNSSLGYSDDPSSQYGGGSDQRDRVVLNQQPSTSGSKGSGGPIDYDNEPPILEELGIKPEEIVKKFMAIITQRGFKEVSTYEDMAGALFVLFLFGLLLLLRGNYQFGNIYGAGSTGCLCIFFMINLLTKKGVYVELYSTMSILGYSLLPFCSLSLASCFVSLQNPIGIGFCLLVILWSTVTATRFFENSLDMQDQRYLIAYPIFLFYCVFLLLVIF